MVALDPNGAFDDAGLAQHELFGALSIDDAALRGFVKFSPSGAFAVDQNLPAHVAEPMIQRCFWNALLFEIVEGVVDAVLAQPNACFFNAVAIGNAVKGDVFHPRIMPQKPRA